MTALVELSKRGVRVVVVLVDGSSFGGFLNTLDALDHLHLAGLPAYVVKKGDDIPAALSHRFSGDGAAPSGELKEVGAAG